MSFPRVMFVYWGRMGLSQFVLEIARAAIASNDLHATVSVSRQNEAIGEFAFLGDRLLAVDTFSSPFGALARSWTLPRLYAQLLRRLELDRIEYVVELMPHVWSSLLLPRLRHRGIKYASIVHDAEPHPGDFQTARVRAILQRSAKHADIVFTLSATVANRLIQQKKVEPHRICQLLHPDLSFGSAVQPSEHRSKLPLRLLWLGRVLPYKGLKLFVDAVEAIKADGHDIEIGVFGAGVLGPEGARLRQLGAEVVNRWLTNQEIAEILRRFDVLVLSHVEASQSGIAATALGAGLPAVATPVAGLVEQLDNGTAVIADDVNADALATAIVGLVTNRRRLANLRLNIEQYREQRSVSSFLAQCVARLTRAGD